MPLTTHQLTPNAIALLVAGTDSDNMERTLFQCVACNLLYCWADLVEQQVNAALCPRCGSGDLATNAEGLLELPETSLSFSSLT